MAPPTSGLRVPRIGSASQSGLCLEVFSGRGIGAWHPAAYRFHSGAVYAWGLIRPVRRGPCWRLQRPEADLPADRQLCPRPGATRAGTWLLGQERRWDGLRIAALILSARGNPAASTPATPMPTHADPLAQLLAALLAYHPQPRPWLRPRPPYLPHPRRRLPRLRGLVRSAKAWLKPATIRKS